MSCRDRSHSRQPWRALCSLALAVAALSSLSVVEVQALNPLQQEAPAPSGSNPKCLTFAAQAPYRGYGYDHIVEIRNGCDKPAACSVKTNVNPTAVEQTVPSGASHSVVTFRGSPSREFTPQVSCRLLP
jgi:septal ring-binding cell division protein DamX